MIYSFFSPFEIFFVSLYPFIGLQRTVKERKYEILMNELRKAKKQTKKKNHVLIYIYLNIYISLFTFTYIYIYSVHFDCAKYNGQHCLRSFKRQMRISTVCEANLIILVVEFVFFNFTSRIFIKLYVKKRVNRIRFFLTF